MATVSHSFDTKIQLALDAKVGRMLANMEQMSACAGIKNDPENAFKARVNHYGGKYQRKFVSLKKTGEERYGRPVIHSVEKTVGVELPERHFVDVPLEKNSELLKKFEEEVMQLMTGGRARIPMTGATSGEFAAPGSQARLTASGNESKTLKAIAKALADAQVEALENAEPPNKESTIKRKGFDAPLRETYSLERHIRGWVEK